MHVFVVDPFPTKLAVPSLDPWEVFVEVPIARGSRKSWHRKLRERFLTHVSPCVGLRSFFATLIDVILR